MLTAPEETEIQNEPTIWSLLVSTQISVQWVKKSTYSLDTVQPRIECPAIPELYAGDDES